MTITAGSGALPSGLVDEKKRILELDTAIGKVIGRSAQAANRQDAIADYLKSRLEDYGLPGVRGGSSGELKIKGMARTKEWDIAYNFAGKDRLLISLKSIWKNAGGSVPNRIDDLMGEAANVQQMAPEIVVGYMLLFDSTADSLRTQDQKFWSEYFENCVKKIAIRKAPLWNQGLIEGALFIKFDSKKPEGSRLVDPAKVMREEEAFLSGLLKELRLREPAIPFTKPLS